MLWASQGLGSNIKIATFLLTYSDVALSPVVLPKSAPTLRLAFIQVCLKAQHAVADVLPHLNMPLAILNPFPYPPQNAPPLTDLLHQWLNTLLTHAQSCQPFVMEDSTSTAAAMPVVQVLH